MSASGITFKLSALGKVRDYLAAISVDIRPLQDQLQLAEDKVASMRVPQVEAVTSHNQALVEYKAARIAKEAEVKAAEEKADQFGEVDFFGSGKRELHSYCTDPKSKLFNPELMAAVNERDRLRAELTSIQYPSGSMMASTNAVLREAESAAESARREIHHLEERVRMTAEQLPNGAVGLGRDALERIAGVTITTFEDQGIDLAPHWPDVSDAMLAGMIRGEIPIDCIHGCDHGHLRLGFSNIEGVDLVLNDEVRHPVCVARSNWNSACLDGAVPPKFAAHRAHSLAAYGKSPINLEVQRQTIGMIPSMVRNLNGWLMVGRAGTSKTTYAAAAITDMLTFRAAFDARPYDSFGYFSSEAEVDTSQLNYWRLKVPKWIQDTESFKNRDFGDQSVPEPELTPHAVETATSRTGLPPIVWMEELDKVGPTAPRLRYLYSLVDAVYESGGIIISTSNMKAAELKKHLEEPIYRRLCGENDPDGEYLVWDFWKMEKLTAADLQKLKQKTATT
jgi:hypothetical protein